jgi:hypothetical protein
LGKELNKKLKVEKEWERHAHDIIDLNRCYNVIPIFFIR